MRIPFLRPSPLFRYRSANSWRQCAYEQLMLSAEPEAGPDFNLALVYGPVVPEWFDEVARKFFGSNDYAIAVESEVASQFEVRLLAEGWEMVEEEPAMLLRDIPDVSPSASAISIKLVTTEAEYEEFMTLVPESRHWVPHFDASQDPDVALFVGYFGGEPISTARLTCFGEVGEITGITTLDQFRRRGFGTAMTEATIAEASRRGCTALTLTATPMGHSTYLRLGFSPICSYRTYLYSEQGADLA